MEALKVAKASLTQELSREQQRAEASQIQIKELQHQLETLQKLFTEGERIKNLSKQTDNDSQWDKIREMIQSSLKGEGEESGMEELTRKMRQLRNQREINKKNAI